MITVEANGELTLVKLERTPASVGKAVAAAMLKVGQGLLAHLKESELSGQSLAVRTGMGRRSAFYRVATDDKEVFVVVGSDLRKAPQMRAHDKGATITPKRATVLTIPIGEARTSKGVARFTARDVIANPESFGYLGTFVKDGVLFGRRGKKERAVPLFVFASSVRLRAVGYLARTRNEKRAWAEGVIQESIGEAVQ